MTQLQQIRQEIERNRQAIRVLNEHTAPEQMSKTCAIFQYSDSILSELLSFINSLPEEQPSEDLEKEIDKRYLQTRVVGYVDGVGEITLGREAFERIARHFYELGLRRAAEMYDEIEYNRQRAEEAPDKSLEEAAEEYASDYPAYNDEQAIAKYAFKAGAEWQASQMPMPEDTVLFQKGVAEGRRLEREDMMHDAVEVTVQSPILGPPMVCCIANGCSDGDKVRIVVLKAEEE